MEVNDKQQSYRIEKKIGQGGGGEIYHVQLLVGQSDLNIRAKERKTIAKIMKDADGNMFVQEVSIMAMFSTHPNVYILYQIS